MRAALLLFVAALLLPSLAVAGCEKDTDCKGDRICDQGECVDPAPGPSAGVPPKLIRLSGDRYQYQGEVIAWDEARAIMSLYSRSDETLRKGRGYSTVGGIFLGIGGAMLATGIGFAIGDATATARYDRYSEQGTEVREGVCQPGDDDCEILGRSFSIGGGLMIAGGMPFAILGGTAKSRAIERYNRAVERGEIDRP